MASKSVLITGCSAGGIGAAIALVLAKQGHHIFATARTPAKISDELSGLENVTVIALDVNSTSSIKAAAAVVEQSGRGLDVLLNNAGVGYPMPVLDMDIDKAKAVYEANLWGPIRVIQAFADLLIARRGRIVNLSSCGAVVNTPWISAYSTSKAAFTQLSEVLRLELSPFGVSVVAIMAGTVMTHFHDPGSAFKLPEDSRYAPIEDIIAGWASGKSTPTGCSAEEFAQKVASVVVRNDINGLTWKGPYASLMKFLSNWAPRFMGDYAMSTGQGLHELTSKLTGDKKGL